MAFASIFVPNFRVQAVVRAEPELCGRALALVEGTPPLCNVVAVNERAARMGIEIGMTKANAEQFAGLEIRGRSETLEKSAHAALLDAGWSVSPRIEDAGEDEIVLDIAGLSALFGGEAEIGAELARRVFECGLQANVAIAGNLDTASIAARGCGGITVIARGEEVTRLRDLPVRVLRPAEETAETLERWGVWTCGMLTMLSVEQLSERLGQEGVRLHELARGASVRSLHVAATADCFEEEMELEEAVEELDPLSFLLGRLLDQLCARLVTRALSTASIRVKFELQPNFEEACDRRKEVVREKNPPRDYETELQLPVPARNAKMLLKLLRLRLQARPPGAAIQKISVVAEAARPRTTQGELFLPSFPDPEKLELTIARIANVVGEGNVGSPEIVDTHRPDAIRMRRFEVMQAERIEKRPEVLTPDEKVIVAFRTFRPEIPARVELLDGRPAAVIFQGAHGKVRAAAGPWKTSGDWWREDAWEQEEWDLEIQFRAAAPADATNAHGEWALYRVYFDARREGWFVRGIYD
jgi:protein ImuB